MPALTGVGARMAASAAVLLSAALLFAAGCGTGSGSGTAATDPPTAAHVSVSVSVVQNRSDMPVGRMQLRVSNEGRQALAIRRATLESAALSGPAVWARGTTIPAGGTRDLPVRFPGAGCAEAAEKATVRLEVEETAAGATVDGAEPRVTTLEVPAADPHGRIRILTDADCFSREVAAVGELSLGGLRVGAAADPAELEIRVVSAGAGAGTGAGPGITVESMESTVLFSAVDPGGAPVRTAPVGVVLGPGAAAAAASVPILPARCDPHALAEDKVGTLFRFAVQVHGGRSGTVTLAAPPALRSQLSEFFLVACGL